MPQPKPQDQPDLRWHDPLLNIEVRRFDQHTTVLRLLGEADISAVPSLREAVMKAVDGDVRCVVVELDELTFFDAAMLDWLAETRKRLAATEVSLRVSCPSSRGQRLLRATALDFLLA